MDITFNDLEEAALAVIQDIQSFNEYKNQRLTVCGGMAVVYYTQSAARTTKVHQCWKETETTNLIGCGLLHKYSRSARRSQEEIGERVP